MNIAIVLFYGPYWAYCALRAIMVGPTLSGTGQQPPYGAFNTAHGLIYGIVGSAAWLICLLIILALLSESITALATKRNRHKS